MQAMLDFKELHEQQTGLDVAYAVNLSTLLRAAALDSACTSAMQC